MFPNNIILHENKRCKSKEDQVRIKTITKNIREAPNKEALINILKSNFKIITRPEDIKTKKNVVALNKTAEWLNELLHVEKDENKYYVGLELICKKSLKIGKTRVSVNGTYEIIDIDDDIFTLMEMEEAIVVDKEIIKSAEPRVCRFSKSSFS